MDDDRPLEAPLPPELILHILEYLSIPQLFRLARVSHGFRESVVPRALFARLKSTDADLIVRVDSPSSGSSDWSFVRLWPAALEEEEKWDGGRVAVFEFRPWDAVFAPEYLSDDIVEEHKVNARPQASRLPGWLVPQSLFVPPVPPPIDQAVGTRRKGVLLGGRLNGTSPVRLLLSSWEAGRAGAPFSLPNDRFFVLPESSTDGSIQRLGDIDVLMEYRDLPPTCREMHLRTIEVIAVRCTMSFLALGFSAARVAPASTFAIWDNRIRLPPRIRASSDPRVEKLSRSIQEIGLDSWIIFKYEFARRYLTGSLATSSDLIPKEMAVRILVAERADALRRGDPVYRRHLEKLHDAAENGHETWLGALGRRARKVVFG